MTVVVVLLAAGAHAAPRIGGSPLTGVAQDTSGAVLPGVTVTIANAAAAHAEPVIAITNDTGRFTVDQLGPGTYSVVFSLTGFGERRFDAVVLPTDDELRAVLEPAAVAETVVVRAQAESDISSAPAGETAIHERVLNAVPLANDRFEDALPLLPGTLRGPDGLLNMHGARADQSSLVMNGADLTDPVTRHFAVRLPIEAIETVNVHGGVYSAAVGNATGGVTDVVLRSGQDKRAIQFQNFLPRIRFADGGIRGIEAFTPRLRVSGPIRPGRLWFSESMSFRFVRSRVDELEPLDASEQKVKSFDSISQLDYAMRPGHHLTATFVAFPSNVDNAGIDTLHPFDATSDLKQRGWLASVADRSVLSARITLASSFAVKQYDMNVAPKYDVPSLVTVTGVRNNYFNRFDRNSRRYDANSTLSVAVPHHWGEHLLRTGVQVGHTSYDGIDASLPVDVARADGTLFQRIEFLGKGAVSASATDVAAFVEDQWSVHPRLTVHAGVRFADDGIASGQAVAPRVDAVLRPFSNGRTVVKAGFGRFSDTLPLNAADFQDHQARRVIGLGDQGQTFASTLLTPRTPVDALRTPLSTTWNVELDQMVARNLLARVRYRNTHGSDQLVVDPLAEQGTLLLSSRGRSRSHEFEATVRRQFDSRGQVNVSYVRSSTRGNLNDFVSLYGDLRDPIIRADEYARQSFDVPNRFLAWGIVNLPRGFVVAPTVEYRTGFPYTVIDQEQRVVGTRNEGGRFPHLFTLDLAVTKDVRITKTKRVRVGVQTFNLTNHFNPRDVQNNVDAATFGQFANSADFQIRTKFTFLF